MKRRRITEEPCRSVYCDAPEWRDGWCEFHHPDSIAARELAFEKAMDAAKREQRRGKP